jgi:hypothetical protein
LRVSNCGYHVGYARSVTELERRIELAELLEASSRLTHRSSTKPAVPVLPRRVPHSCTPMPGT